ncbi:oxidoreductase [Chitinophaga terrae (ex Kim and Jung 2007)]|nr:oxidoreductase [Chitinophaga terrae (ex Kim and Jung 2007)]
MFPFTKKSSMQLIALDPGHFHASLVQQEQYPGVDTTIKVFAPAGKEVEQYLQQVANYNQKDSPKVYWATDVYTGPGYLQRMLQCERGSIVILAGNNRLKPAYIQAATRAGMHVLADKPMAIDAAGFDSLKAAFATAAANHTQLYDIMTERYEIHNVLQKALSQIPAIFGTPEKGEPGNPAVIKKSIHHFKKTVAGKPLVRPAWYMDTREQGEGITDVTTHLVDLVQWTCFPEQELDYLKDISINSARAWPTMLNKTQYAAITGETEYNAALQSVVGKDGLLPVYANGSFDYNIRGLHARITVQWDYEAPEGGGDTHYSLLKGSKAALLVLQDKEQQYRPTLYIQPVENSAAYTKILHEQFALLNKQYPGVALREAGDKWEVIVPAALIEVHEQLFARVMKRFLQYVQAGEMPAWEISAMLAKYYTTTQAREKAGR